VQGRSFTWDFENRLTQASNPGVGTTTFRYDPFGRRIQKSGPLGTTNYLYDGTTVEDELDNSGNVLARYTATTDVDDPLAERRGSTGSYYQQDGLGSVTSLSNGSGAPTNTYTFDSFGNLTASTGTLANSFQYTGRESDLETGLYYYRARYYDPQGGRFISEDPIGFFGGRNFYRYVGNRPVQDVDPSGHGPNSQLRKNGTGDNTYCMDTTLGLVCWGNKKEDLMRLALSQPNLRCCLRQFFGNDISLNMKTLPLIDSSHNLHGAAIGETDPSDNAGNARPVVRIDRGSFAQMTIDDLVMTYWHETANALADHLFTKYPLEDRGWLGPKGAYPSSKQRNDPWDADIGNQFEKCLTKK